MAFTITKTIVRKKSEYIKLFDAGVYKFKITSCAETENKLTSVKQILMWVNFIGGKYDGMAFPFRLDIEGNWAGKAENLFRAIFPEIETVCGKEYSPKDLVGKEVWCEFIQAVAKKTGNPFMSFKSASNANSKITPGFAGEADDVMSDTIGF